MGKVIHILDANNSEITNTTHIGNINPIRYRGYYYDTETAFYYVSSRYHDLEIGRWINADNMITSRSDLTGLNLFAYCGNNPVNRIDPSGQFWISAIIKAVVVAVVAVVAKVACTVKETKRVQKELDSLPEPTMGLNVIELGSSTFFDRSNKMYSTKYTKSFHEFINIEIPLPQNNNSSSSKFGSCFR